MTRDENKKYFPAMVDGNDFEIFKKIKSLPKKTHDILLSDEIVDFVFGVEQRFHLQDDATEDFSRTVRQYFFREITEQGFAQKVSQLCHISLEEAMKILRVIVTIDPTDESRKHNATKEIVFIPLNEALSKYPKIKDQKITSRSITSKPFLQPLKPTVKNWIMVYEKILDVSRHNAIERGEFVFRSEATRGLADVERKVLAILFKSRDENTKIAINVATNEIDFSIDVAQDMNGVVNRKIKENGVFKSLDQSTMQDTRIHTQNKDARDIKSDHVVKEKVIQNPTFAAIQKEILKNRDEMTSGSNHLEVQKKPNSDKGVVTKDHMVFSSNHTLPSEKNNNRSLQPTKNYLHITPIGSAHNTIKQSGDKNKKV